jgi:tetratricopeptide (TPR) repeat protein
MVEWARQHGSTPYFILLGDSPNQTEPLQRGIALLERKDYEEAIKQLTPITSTFRLPALARQYLSIAYRETGRIDQAEQVLLIEPMCSSHGGTPVLQDTDYHKAMRDVAEEYNVTLVDAASKLDETPRVFFDDLNHFDAEAHEMVGKLVRDVLANAR